MNYGLFYCCFIGATVTLQHPYLNDIPEPTQYERVTRHAELGKKTSFDMEMAESAPDLHVSYLIMVSFSG